MTETPEFAVSDFLPYLLNRAAEDCSAEFAQLYKNRFGLLRTEWRVLFHLGQFGAMTATEMTNRANIHKTKISRAVSALHRRRLLDRQLSPTDRRSETLSLTPNGEKMFAELAVIAKGYHDTILEKFTAAEQKTFVRILQRLID